MEVTLKPELSSKLARMAADQGRSTEDLVEEAVERFVGFDDWFKSEVQKGLDAAARGDLIEQEQVRELINRRYPG